MQGGGQTSVPSGSLGHQRQGGPLGKRAGGGRGGQAAVAAQGRTAVGACGFPQPSLLVRPGKVSPALVFALAEVKERTVAGAQCLSIPPPTPQALGEACLGPNRYLGRGK